MEDSNQILSIDAVMAAMSEYAASQKRHDKARAEYEGYSWGYHGWSYIRDVDESKVNAEKVLEQYIEACVQRAISKLEVKNGY